MPATTAAGGCRISVLAQNRIAAGLYQRFGFEPRVIELEKNL